MLAPPSLTSQWFVELLRRFNLPFALFDEERCESIELHHPEANPFLDSQLVLCAVGFLAVPWYALQDSILGVAWLKDFAGESYFTSRWPKGLA